ncbi:hypothetical protein ACMGDM_08580 [Sphingomonas sp. DT-51]|uniref:hypothetical protein n=1 Tax=Sphingomonas sp. DT-51 TaxID=3396165 RepID=UPI003F1AEC92
MTKRDLDLCRRPLSGLLVCMSHSIIRKWPLGLRARCRTVDFTAGSGAPFSSRDTAPRPATDTIAGSSPKR